MELVRGGWLVVGACACALVACACSFQHGRLPGSSDGRSDTGDIGSAGDSMTSSDGPGTVSCSPPGSGCDDGNACTGYDSCVGGACQGVDYLCPASCANSCSSPAACGGDTCCHQICPGSGISTCPSCPAGCTCDLQCPDSGGGDTCNLTCGDGARCKLTSWASDSDGDIVVTCQAGSQCIIDCLGNEGSCTVNCLAGASCVMIDRQSPGPATLTCAGGTTMTCPSPNTNTSVCRHACP